MDMWEDDVNSNPDRVFKDDDNQKNLQKLFMTMGWSQFTSKIINYNEINSLNFVICHIF